ncbi:prepilin-type N-terminal cleavage/methylation domain-containing protein [Halomonas koreensis]|uniref:Prepilin-type N-terminal cleavage/methylation domain-containing protein n=1 Tax=Halomonas koreensis TaxID=245385 RepID=A0ABU1G4L9_9GAMM|nr:prepilin-type N-terminal cleavage/methylation domain-containing protein [Halomonas koreensis]MDR5867892.1 prepilin-type N-terminal cleavage/methylation domain-containing protein [Halomonas koreensis]
MKKRSCGFSLVELLVALVLGLLVVAGAIQIFVAAKSTFSRMDRLAERQEALRFIADSISRDLRVSPVVYGLDPDTTKEEPEIYISFDPSYPDHPYCGSGSYLHLVRYRGDTASEALDTAFWCGAEDEDINVVLSAHRVSSIEDSSGSPVTPSGSEVLQEEIEAVTFSKKGYAHLASVATSTFQVETRVSLSEELWPGASASQREFLFNTFRREELMSRLELVPVFASGAGGT